MKQRITIFRICLVALAAVLNIAGGQLALMLRLPIYLDSIGTIMTGILAGPWFGLLPGLISGFIMGVTTDIYSLYFAPSGMITGLLAGLILYKRPDRMAKFWLYALMISIPGTIVSSVISAFLFGGVTSSGSTVLVQLLAKTPLGLTASIFMVQVVTDYLDRGVGIFLIRNVLPYLPQEMKQI